MNNAHSNRFRDELATPAPQHVPQHAACFAGGEGCALANRYGRWKFCVLILSLAMICVLLAGCSDAQLETWKADVARYQQQLNTARVEVDNLIGENNLLEQALAEAQASIPQDDPEAKAAWEAQIAALRDKLGGIQSKIDTGKQVIDEYANRLNALGDQILAAESGEEAIGSTVSSVGAMISTATGQPLIALFGGLIGAGIRMLGDRKRKALAAEAGAMGVANGIEAHRNTDLESLDAMGGRYLVIEKAGAAISHEAAGVADAIAKVSKAADAAIAK